MALLLEDYSGYEKVADITVLAVERLQGVKCPYGEYQDIRPGAPHRNSKTTIRGQALPRAALCPARIVRRLDNDNAIHRRNDKGSILEWLL